MTESNDVSEKKEDPFAMVDVPEALRRVLYATSKVILSRIQGNTDDATETVDLCEKNCSSSQILMNSLLGRIVAADVVAPHPGYPNYNASIMDGYAIKYTEELIEEKNGSDGLYIVQDHIYAGDDVSSNQQENQTEEKNSAETASYVTTGAVIPSNYDTVIPIETVTEFGKEAGGTIKKHIQISSDYIAQIKKGQWIRPIGCDIPPESIIIQKGTVITSIQISLLVQLQIPHIELTPKVTVGILSTGNELLLSPFDNNNNKTGKIPDVNRPMLLALLHELSPTQISAIDLGIAKDDVLALKDTIQNAFLKHNCDILVTTGGVSMGEKDHLLEVFENLPNGNVKTHFRRLNMKPGKPTKFMTYTTNVTESNKANDGNNQKSTKQHLILALPGNPVSAYVCSNLFLRPMVNLFFSSFWNKRFQSNHDIEKKEEKTSDIDRVSSMVHHSIVHNELYVQLGQDFRLDKERPEYHRVILIAETNRNSSHDHVKKFVAYSTGVQRSSRIMSLSGAHGLLCLPRGSSQKSVCQKGEDGYLCLLLADAQSAPSYRGLWREAHTQLGNINDEEEDLKQQFGCQAKNSIHLRETLLVSSVRSKSHHHHHHSTTGSIQNVPRYSVGLIFILDPSSFTITNNPDELLDHYQRDTLTYLEKSFTASSKPSSYGIHLEFIPFATVKYLSIDTNSQENKIQDSLRKKLAKCHDVDIVLLINLTSSPNNNKFMYRSTTAAACLRDTLTKKSSDAMSISARQGAASENPLAALYEIVLGFHGKQFIIGNIPDIGVKGALSRILPLLNHAISIGRSCTK